MGKNFTKALAVLALAAAMTVTAVPAASLMSTTSVYAAETEKITPAKIADSGKIDSLTAQYTVDIAGMVRGASDSRTVKFTIPSDSWVYIGTCTSKYDVAKPWLESSINGYSDSAMTKSIFKEISFKANQTGNYSGFLKKGTYYIDYKYDVWNGFEEGYSFNGQNSMTVAYIPLSKAFKPTVKVAKNKKSAKLYVKDVLGSYIEKVQFCKGSVSPSRNADDSYWHQEIDKGSWGFFPQEAQYINANGSSYSKTVGKNGTYTFWVQTGSGSQYSKIVRVKGLKK